MKKNGKILSLILAAGMLAVVPWSETEATSLTTVIRKVKRGDRNALTSISSRDFTRLHNYRGKYYYIPRFIGKKAVRSLFGCFRNPDREVRRLCADNLYQFKLTYVHKKLILYYMQKETHKPTRLALQDLMIRIDEERFAEARRLGDRNFLTKIDFDHIQPFTEKGYPSGGAYTDRDIRFLRGGLGNKDYRMRVYVIRMMGRVRGADATLLRVLAIRKKRESNTSVRRAIDESIRCIRSPRSCPDLYGPSDQ